MTQLFKMDQSMLILESMRKAIATGQLQVLQKVL